MTVIYYDELGVIAVKINDAYGVQFGTDKAYFTDENGTDYKINISQISSITKAE